MKAITLWQPWATLVADGVKDKETRSRSPASMGLPYWWCGQQLAIHAAKAAPKTLQHGGINGRTYDRMVESYGYQWQDLIPRGSVLATVTLSCAHPVQGVVDTATGLQAVFPLSHELCSQCGRRLVAVDPYGDFSPGRWIWMLTDLKKLDVPVPAQGHQGIWQWNEICLVEWEAQPEGGLYETLCDRQRGEHDVTPHRNDVTCPECIAKYRGEFGISRARIGGT